MDFRSFKAKYRRYPVIKSSYFSLEDKPAYVRRLVSEWLKKGWLIQLRRGAYLLNDEETLEAVERFSLANLLYEPSYVSMESALSFYGMIPEVVAQVTSVSSRKRAKFSNALGTFTYFSVKAELFWGYSKQRLAKGDALIASPEKALLDLVYLRRGELSSVAELVESLRIEDLSRLKPAALRAAGKRFESPKVRKVAFDLAKAAGRGRRRR